MSPSKGDKALSKEGKESSLRALLTKPQETSHHRNPCWFYRWRLAVLWNLVDRILIAHYELNKKWLDISFVTLLGALFCVILWRWFSRTEKRPGNVKAEVLIVPLIVLVALAIDLILFFQIAGFKGKGLLIGQSLLSVLASSG